MRNTEQVDALNDYTLTILFIWVPHNTSGYTCWNDINVLCPEFINQKH